MKYLLSLINLRKITQKDSFIKTSVVNFIFIRLQVGMGDLRLGMTPTRLSILDRPNVNVKMERKRKNNGDTIEVGDGIKYPNIFSVFLF